MEEWWKGYFHESQLDGYHYQNLFYLQERYGAEKLKYATKEGIELKRLNLRYVRRILENPKCKGEEKDDTDEYNAW